MSSFQIQQQLYVIRYNKKYFPVVPYNINQSDIIIIRCFYTSQNKLRNTSQRESRQTRSNSITITHLINPVAFYIQNTLSDSLWAE